MLILISLGAIKEGMSRLPINVFEMRLIKRNCHHSQVNNEKNITSKYAKKQYNKYALLIFTFLMPYKKFAICEVFLTDHLFNNILVTCILRWSVLLVEETGVHGENYKGPATSH